MTMAGYRKPYRKEQQSRGRNAPNWQGQGRGREQTSGPAYNNNPYNFVPLWERVYRRCDSMPEAKCKETPERMLPSHGRMETNLLSGTIHCTFTAQTPVCVSNGERDRDNDFFRDASGRYVLPGSTLKGLVRTNMLTLGMGALRPGEDFDDTRMLYRDMTSADWSVRGRLKKQYEDQITVEVTNGQNTGAAPKKVANVCGCYLKREGKQYFLYRSDYCTVRRFQYTLEERTQAKETIDFEAREEIRRREDDLGKWLPSREKNEIKDTVRRRVLKPYINPVLHGALQEWAFDVARERPVWYQFNGKRITALSSAERGLPAPNGKWNRGLLLAPGFMNDQNTLYLFPAFDPTAERFRWREEDRLAYEMDYDMRENVLGGTDTQDPKEKLRRKEFWMLPGQKIRTSKGQKPRYKGNPLPFFLLGRWEDLAVPAPPGSHDRLIQKNPVALGKSPYHRIAYRHTPSEGVPEEHRKAAEQLTLDYPYALLGFSFDGEENGKKKTWSYRSRVSFEDFHTDAAKEDRDQFKLPMGSPKPTSFSDYLLRGENQQGWNNYNDEGFQLRGIKQYWLHRPENDALKEDKKFYSDFTVLKEGTSFSGQVRFHNLREDELGLLLWCLRLDEGCSQTVGKGKPYGYGRMKVRIDRVERLLPERLYSVRSLAEPVTEPLEAEKLVEAYVQYIEGELKLDGRSFRDLESISVFLYLHRVNREPEDVRYLQLGKNRSKNEFQNRKSGMPTVAQQREALERKHSG